MGVPSPVPYRLQRLAGQKRRYGINFAYGGTGVFDTFLPLPNMTTQMDFFEKLIDGGIYRGRDLRSSMAFVSNAGNDYVSYLYVFNGTIPVRLLNRSTYRLGFLPCKDPYSINSGGWAA